MTSKGKLAIASVTSALVLVLGGFVFPGPAEAAGGPPDLCNGARALDGNFGGQSMVSGSETSDYGSGGTVDLKINNTGTDGGSVSYVVNFDGQVNRSLTVAPGATTDEIYVGLHPGSYVYQVYGGDGLTVYNYADIGNCTKTAPLPPTTAPLPPTTTVPELPDNVSRIAGANRYATAADIAVRSGTTRAVIVANGETAKQGFDALSANYLAGRVDAPILLTQANTVSSATLSAAKSVLKASANPVIYVMGGVDSVAGSVVDQFTRAADSVSTGSVKVIRVAGANRYATSALAVMTPGAVTNSLSLSADGNVLARTAILASGEVNADALAAGALSYAWGIPVLLTPANMAQQTTYSVIKELGITQVIVLGGPDRVSPAVVSQLESAGVVSVKRIAGASRYDTAAQLYSFAVDTLQNVSGDHYGAGTTVYLANGMTGFPDALAVGPLVGKNGDVLLTSASNKLGSSAISFFKTHSQFVSVIGLGSASTITDSVLAAAAKAVG
ncbi:MAG: cell wall-binding repeat-containing protein [Candidatus Saccharimonadales bacterium]